MIRRERDQLLTSAIKERISCDQEACDPPFDQCSKRNVDVPALLAFSIKIWRPTREPPACTSLACCSAYSL